MVSCGPNSRAAYATVCTRYTPFLLWAPPEIVGSETCLQAWSMPSGHPPRFVRQRVPFLVVRMGKADFLLEFRGTVLTGLQATRVLKTSLQWQDSEYLEGLGTALYRASVLPNPPGHLPFLVYHVTVMSSMQYCDVL